MIEQSARRLTLQSPLGPLTLEQEGGNIVALGWGDDRYGTGTILLAEARRQIEDYFKGRRKAFDLPLAPRGTAFQQRVWQQLREIPYGRTLSYGALAAVLSSGPRAVGMACARNPLPLLIPCHRVIGSNGALTGYSGGEGLATKRYLLRLEGTIRS